MFTTTFVRLFARVLPLRTAGTIATDNCKNKMRACVF